MQKTAIKDKDQDVRVDIGVDRTKDEADQRSKIKVQDKW